MYKSAEKRPAGRRLCRPSGVFPDFEQVCALRVRASPGSGPHNRKSSVDERLAEYRRNSTV